MARVLVSWIGGNDLKAIPGEAEVPEGNGPVLSTLLAQHYSTAYLLYNYPKKEVQPYVEWLSKQVPTTLRATYHKLRSPVHFGDIHDAADALLRAVTSNHPKDSIDILLSPGTPAMQAVWILLGKTKYQTDFVQSSVQQGVQRIEIPFDIAAEYVPDAAARVAHGLTELAAGTVPIDAAFDDILTRNPRMQAIKAQATVMAAHDVPVLIYGESGTGKELFARAIHNASRRSDGPFIAVNCGAFPPDLIDSALFGHVKGAFTDAKTNKAGFFEAADRGTLFLDEFGELPLEAQVRLLRVLQEGEITPVGATASKRVDVRVVAATNRDLVVAIAQGSFREDLFYRIAVGVLNLPPLRDRTGDVLVLAQAMLDRIASLAAGPSGQNRKKLSVNARNLLQKHPWKGNVRELYSTLLRAQLWSAGERITDTAIQAAFFQVPEQGEGILGRPVSQGIDLTSIIGEVVAHYAKRALDESGGRKTKAAELLGLNNYQTLTNWMEKYGVKD